MGHIRDKFLPGIIQRFHPSQHLIKGVSNQLCLRIIRNRYLFVLETVRNILDGSRHLGKRLHKNSRQHISQSQHQNSNNYQNQQPFLLQDFYTGYNLLRRYTDQENAVHLLLLFQILINWKRHLNIPVLTVINIRFLPLTEAVHHLR